MSTALSIKEDYWSPKGCSFVRITTLEALRHLCSAKARFIMLHLRSTTCPRREDPLQKGNQHSFMSHIAMMAASQLFSLWPSSLKQHIYIYMHIHMHRCIYIYIECALNKTRKRLQISVSTLHSPHQGQWTCRRNQDRWPSGRFRKYTLWWLWWCTVLLLNWEVSYCS